MIHDHYYVICIVALLMMAALVNINGYGILIRNIFDKKENLIGYELILGFSFSILLLSLYFIFPINLRIISYIWSTFGIILFFYFSFKKVNPTNLKLIIISFAPIGCFLIYGMLYGSNFYVFRGNIWDWFNYNSMAVGYSKYTISEFPTLIAEGNPLSFIAASNINNRPFVAILPAAILSIIKIDSFMVMYLYKAFLLSILFVGYIVFLTDLMFDFMKSILISISLLFSSWIFYVVEIDALSNLAYLAFLPVIASVLYRTRDLSFKVDSIPIGLILAASFCIYPEFSIICLGGLFFTLIIKFLINRNFYDLTVNNIKTIIITSILIVAPFSTSTVYFLCKQIIGGITIKVDWWGYYGGFIFGPNSPVINPEIVLKVKEEVSKGENIFGNSYLLNTIFENVLMILPSIFGFFHLLSIPFFVYVVFIFGLFACIIYLDFLKPKNDQFIWIRIVSALLVVLIITLLLLGSYWGAFKALSYLMIFMSLVFPILLLKHKNKIVRYTLIVMFCSLPIFTIYKYSVYNYGIGKFDGFPSILKPLSKINYSWVFNLFLYQSCNLVSVKINDPFYRHFVLLNLENHNIPYKSLFPLMESYGVGKVVSQPKLSNNSYDCSIE